MGNNFATWLWGAAFAACGLYSGYLVATIALLAFWLLFEVQGSVPASFARIVCLLAFTVGLLEPAIRERSDALRPVRAVFAVKEVALAIDRYHAMHRRFPQVSAEPDEEALMHSWRTELLPFLESGSMLDGQIVRRQPWNANVNQGLARVPLSEFSLNLEPQTQSDLYAPAGEGTCWSSNGKRVRIGDLREPSKTLMLIAMPGRGTPWCKPEDPSVEEVLTWLTDETSRGYTRSVNHGWVRRSDRTPVYFATADCMVHWTDDVFSRKEGEALVAANHPQKSAVNPDRKGGRAVVGPIDWVGTLVGYGFLVAALVPLCLVEIKPRREEGVLNGLQGGGELSQENDDASQGT
ncbi:MAG: DUF1559 domain-containing protein [Lacipirellulaceae bacterium]